MSTTERTYGEPIINGENQAYWEAANEGRLQIKTCSDCGKVHFYPRSVCPHCFSQETQWQVCSGKGTIYSYSVLRRADPPFALAYVRLEEGVTMMSNIVDCDLDGLEIGQPVEVTFATAPSGQALPVFRPAEKAGS